MKFYKAMKLYKKISEDQLSIFSSLFSKKENTYFIKENKFIIVPYLTESYYSNEREIMKYFQDGIFSPLVMTNYKFLSVLLYSSHKKEITFSDFSFKYDEESNEAEVDKDKVKSLLNESDSTDNSLNYIEEAGQKIIKIELTIGDFNDKVMIYSSGNLGFSNNFSDAHMDLILELVTFLFTGKITDER